MRIRIDSALAKRTLAFAFMCLIILPTANVNAMAQGRFGANRTQGSTAGEALALDLASNAQSVALSQTHFNGAEAVNINVGGVARTINPGDLVTPAEFVAFRQMLVTGTQEILLNTEGQAVGGHFALGTLNTNLLASLVVPSGVTAIGSAATHLNVTGTLSTMGSLVGTASPTQSWRNFVVSAGDVAVASGGLITTVVPSSIATLVSATNEPVNLSLSSMSNIVNAGTISASGILTLSALGSITNASQATMSGANGVNLYAGNGQLVNNGVIASAVGNVNLNCANTANLVLNNLAGQISALNGAINFRNSQFDLKRLTEVKGGVLSAKSLNFYGGDGAVEVDVQQIDGIVNVAGGLAHITTGGGMLTIGTMELTGDPTIVNTQGSVSLTSSLTFNGQDLAILARDSITVTSQVKSINLSSTSARAGDLTIIAGFEITPATVGQVTDTTNAYTIGAPSANGGNVNLFNVQINTSTSSSGLRGGNVTIVAQNGAGADGNIVTGAINTSSGKDVGGSVMVVAPSVIEIGGGINTKGATGGNINIQGATAQIIDTPTYINGTLQALSGSIAFGPAAAGSTVSVGDLSGANGSIQTSANGGNSGSVIIKADSEIQVNGSIITSANASGATLATGGDVNVETANGFEVIRGDINTLGKTTGGSVTLVGNTPGGIGEGKGVDVGGNIITSGTVTSGDVDISSSSGQINVGFNLSENSPVWYQTNGSIQTNATNVNNGLGTGGNVTLIALSGNVLVGKGITAAGLGDAGDISIIAGGLFRTDSNVTTASTKAEGGNIVITAGTAMPQGGVEVHGAITTVGLTASGDLTMDANLGGVIVTNKITTNNAQSAGGSVTATGAMDIALNSITANGTAGGDVMLASTDGYISVLGAITTAGSTTAAGNLTATSLMGVNVAGALTLTGITQGGNVTMNSGDGNVNITGGINTSGASSLIGAGGNGGSIVLNNGTGLLVTVNGNILVNGGNGAGTGTGGNAGSVLMKTMQNVFGTTPVVAAVGSISINGYIDARGGNVVGAVNAGNGGAVTLESGTVQIFAKNNPTNSSVNTTGGTAGVGGTNGTSAAISITTNGTQPIPTVFDMLTPTATINALPGALFQVGSAAVNGAAGNLVSGTDIALAQKVIGTQTVGTSITMTTSGRTQTINQNGTNIVIDVLSNPLDINSARKLVTPAQALALFQVSRDSAVGAQTFGLTAQGQASDTAVNGGRNTIAIPGYEMGRAITLFVFQNASKTQGPGSLVVNILLTDANPIAHMFMQVPPAFTGVSPINIMGTLNFEDMGTNAVAKVARMDISSASMKVTGQLSASDNVTLNLNFAGQATLVDFGIIKAQTINLTAHSLGFNLFMGNGSMLSGINPGTPGQFTATVGVGTQYSGAINIQNFAPTGGVANASISNMSLNLNGGSILMGVQTPKTKIFVAPYFDSTAGFGQLRTTGSIMLMTPGSLMVSNTGPSGTGGSFVVQSGGTLTLMNATLDSRNNMTLQSTISDVMLTGDNVFTSSAQLLVNTPSGRIASDSLSTGYFQSQLNTVAFTGYFGVALGGSNQINGGAGVTVLAPNGSIAISANANAGTPKTPGLVPFGPTDSIPSTWVKVIGNISMLTPGVINIGDESSFTSLGGNVSIISSINSITLGNQSEFTALGGNVSILAGGAGSTITGGVGGGGGEPGNIFSAQQIQNKNTSGGVEILAGTSASQIQNALTGRPTPAKINVVSGVTVNSLTGSVKGTITIGKTGSGTLTLPNTQGNMIVNTLNGAVLINSLFAGNNITLDSAQVNTIAPTAFEGDESAGNGEALVDTGDDDWNADDASLANLSEAL
jgi:hypothetical protein